MRGGVGGIGFVSETSLRLLRIYFRSTVEMIPRKVSFGYVITWSACQIACVSSRSCLQCNALCDVQLTSQWDELSLKWMTRSAV